MPSVVQGYSYDVFISYRQKDNVTHNKEAAGWITEFVDWLKKEIQAAIKEDISIYFDENSYDGILENHDVHDSLKDKLKCLIFIPILSQTYCDASCFAWKHEFLVFKTISSADEFGLKVKLLNGNVASRILPVCIHDLDASDRRIVEQEIGPLRAIDFVFKSSGVNRPLTASDRREDSISKVFYKDQVNKVANAVKDIIIAMKNPHNGEKIQPVSDHSPRTRRFSRKAVLGALLTTIIAVTLIFYFNKRNSSIAPLEKSIAVLPFVDMTADHGLEYLGDGIAEEIITSLTSLRDLRIVGRTSSFQFKGEKVDLREIGKKLNVATVLEGSIQQSGGKLRITAQLIRTDDNSHFWAETYDVDETDIFKIQDNIAAHIVEKLNLTLSTYEQNRLIKKETAEEVYLIYLKGLFQYKKENFEDALEIFKKVVEEDSLYAPGQAYLGLSKAWAVLRSRDFSNVDRIQSAIGSVETAIKLDPQLPEGYSGRALIAWAINRDYTKARSYFEKSLELDPGSSLIKNRYGYFLTWMGEFDKVSKLAADAIRIDPVDHNSYYLLFLIHVYSGRLADAEANHRELINVLGFNHTTISREITLNFYKGAFGRINELCDSLEKKNSALTDSDLSYNSIAYYALHQEQKGEQYAQQLIKKQKDINHEACYNVARVFAFRNQVDSCFSYLSKSLQKREMNFNHFKIDPAFKHLHKDPRYQALFSAYGFDKY